MNKLVVAIAAFGVLSACSGDNPFDETTPEPAPPDIGTPIGGDRTMPPGTASPTPALGIFRSEPTGNGNGTAESISYDAATDTFSVDNLAFDGANTYSRGTAVGSLGPYAVYEAAAVIPDSVSGAPISQLAHRAIYGISSSANTQFAIVRTGAYSGYGFGGFIYQRTNSVTLPTSGQALYNGVMAGMRDFDGAGGLEYTTADMQVAIDFEDFNSATGVRGTISNRVIYDINGNDITSTVLSRIEVENDITLNSYPVATFTIGPGVMDENGEILGAVESNYINTDGDVETFETGNYYAIISGDGAEEIVGIVVLESTLDPVANTVRETSGFIVYR